MLSLVLIGLEYRGTTSIYNIIAASAFGLLLTDPYLIAHVSFQLSYAAILGIIWLQPMLAKRWDPKNWFVKQGWEIVTASIAAQITTLPLALLYFNQFPSYFLLSNLIIIPISSFVLIIGSAWLVLASIPGLSLIASVAGYITYWLIVAMNWCAKAMASFPSATLNGLYIDKVLFLLLCMAILMTCLAFQHRRKVLLWYAGGFAVLFFADLIYKRYEAFSTSRLTVHSISKKAALSFKTGDKLYMIGDSAVLHDPDMLKYHFQGFANSQFVSEIIPVPDTVRQLTCDGLCYRQPFGQFGSQRFLWLKNKEQLSRLKKGLSLDFVILSSNAKLSVKELREKLSFEKLILTADNSTYRTKKWVEECQAAGINYTNLKKDYSYIVSN
jgi:competence protein ComEC